MSIKILTKIIGGKIEKLIDKNLYEYGSGHNKGSNCNALSISILRTCTKPYVVLQNVLLYRGKLTSCMFLILGGTCVNELTVHIP